MARRNYDERSHDEGDAHRAVSFYNLANSPDPEFPPHTDHRFAMHASHTSFQNRTIVQPLHRHQQYHHPSRATHLAPTHAHVYPFTHHHVVPSANPQVSQQYAVSTGVNARPLYGQVVPLNSSPQPYVSTETTRIPHQYAHLYFLTPMQGSNYSVGGHLIHAKGTTPYHNPHYPHPPVQRFSQPFHPTHSTNPMSNTASQVHTSQRQQSKVTLSSHQDGKISSKNAHTTGGAEKGSTLHANKIVLANSTSMRNRKRRTNAVAEDGRDYISNDIFNINVHDNDGDTRARIGNAQEEIRRAPILGSGDKTSDARKTSASLQDTMHSNGAGPWQLTAGLTYGALVPNARNDQVKKSLAVCYMPPRDSGQACATIMIARNCTGGGNDSELVLTTTRDARTVNNPNNGPQKVAYNPRKGKSTTSVGIGDVGVGDDANVGDIVISRRTKTPTATGGSRDYNLRRNKRDYGLNILASAAEEIDREESHLRCKSALKRQNASATPSQPGRVLFPCSFCPVVVGSKSALNRHIRRIHLHLRPFHCDICFSLFGQRSDLKRHMIVRHSEQVEKKA